MHNRCPKQGYDHFLTHSLESWSIQLAHRADVTLSSQSCCLQCTGANSYTQMKRLKTWRFWFPPVHPDQCRQIHKSTNKQPCKGTALMISDTIFNNVQTGSALTSCFPVITVGKTEQILENEPDIQVISVKNALNSSKNLCTFVLPFLFTPWSHLWFPETQHASVNVKPISKSSGNARLCRCIPEKVWISVNNWTIIILDFNSCQCHTCR